MVGLGLMGSALAKILLENDYPMVVWNRTSQKTEPLVALGARAARALQLIEPVHGILALPPLPQFDAAEGKAFTTSLSKSHRLNPWRP